ncbi:MAG: hypothetical protein CO042_03925 [Parcubacteria group bacterium CG_4_9_14_0_2_um_filter_41_8]|nr:MAG: hypothetical protein COV79_00700 [Parcubacteria group bacterium CG11_big_fil_rev_8_21_14_0_20_41_14]PJC40409.1 MAG: hypothetical protein CO042_03925 [Parcubacteria group bacterium CG_4_9_14_0_2_um_filter_41_8]
MKKIIITILQTLAKRVIYKYKPKVVAITGSVGKTATKEAVFAVLNKKLQVRKNEGNFNTEIGLPLTIIGLQKSPGKNPFKWLAVYARAIGLLIFRIDYPKVLVLEMGADKPGDIAELISIAKPDIGIITAISAVHTEQFNSIAGVVREKGKLFRVVEKDGWIIVNNDRSEVYDIAQKCDAKKVYIGQCAELSDNTPFSVCASEISVSMSEAQETGIAGTSFKIHTDGKVIPVLMKGIIGEHWTYPAMYAAAVARILGVHMVDVTEGLREINPQSGRMRVLAGIKKTILIDDTYNSSPNAAKSAVDTLALLRIGREKYCVFGDMLELGSISEEEHQKLGMLVAREGIDYLICVGERARDIARGAIKAKMPKDHVFEFDNTKDAGLFIQKRLEQGDMVLIKGSQGVRMERVTKEIMAHPEKSKELLVRQSKEWLSKA